MGCVLAALDDVMWSHLLIIAGTWSVGAIFGLCVLFEMPKLKYSFFLLLHSVPDDVLRFLHTLLSKFPLSNILGSIKAIVVGS